MSDIAAGAAAGCRTVLVTCGRHDAPPIVTVDPPASCRPDHVCPDLKAARDWILKQR
jgi:ribonucleotide monophosphatase NagD (HAD superfamily)